MSNVHVALKSLHRLNPEHEVFRFIIVYELVTVGAVRLGDRLVDLKVQNPGGEWTFGAEGPSGWVDPRGGRTFGAV